MYLKEYRKKIREHFHNSTCHNIKSHKYIFTWSIIWSDKGVLCVMCYAQSLQQCKFISERLWRASGKWDSIGQSISFCWHEYIEAIEAHMEDDEALEEESSREHHKSTDSLLSQKPIAKMKKLNSLIFRSNI